jgi:hypothetical protein
MKERRHAWHHTPRLPTAEEKAHEKEIEETFGKAVAKDIVMTVPHYEDTRDDDRKQLADKLRKEIEAGEKAREG